MSRIHPPIVFFAVASVVVLALACPGADQNTWRNPKDGMDFVWVPPGTAHAPGCPPQQKCPESTPATKTIEIRDGFWMGRTEVTVAQFWRFVKETGYATAAEKAHYKFTWKKPGFPQGANHPVVYVHDADALAYARWAGVDLPTAAEWTHAALASASTRFYFGDQIDDRYVWHRENSPVGTHPVGLKLPNAWGLHDMIGNVYEWCKLDEKCDNAVANPVGASWTRCPGRMAYDLPSPPFKCSSLPSDYDDDRGFRCIRRK